MDKAAFPVEFRLAEGETIDAALIGPPIQEIFQYCSQFINLRKAALERVVITHPALMSETIHEFQDVAGRARGHSEGYFQTAGKAIPRVLEDGSVVNTLIIDLRIMLGLIAACQQNIPITEWDLDARFWLSVLVETLGHCIDNAERRDINDQTLDPEGAADYITLAKYYAPIIVGQFVSGVLAGPAITPDLQNREVNNWQLSAKQLIDPLLDQKFSSNGISDSMSNTSHNFWAVLIQYASLVGHTLSNSNLDEVQVWRSSNQEFLTALNEISVYLKQLWKDYPKLPSDDAIAENLLPSWQKLAEAYGFIFGAASPSDENTQMTIPSSSTKKSGFFFCAGTTTIDGSCKDEKFYQEYEGRQYCILHFPGEDKKEGFLKALERKFKVKDFNFQGIWFPDVVFFPKETIFNDSTDFSGAYFNQPVIFSQPQFESDAKFSNAHFSKDVSFTNGEFNKVDFSSAKFDADVKFDGAQFKADAIFSGAQFKADADFSFACFYKDVEFGKVMFNANVSFNRTRFVTEIPKEKGADTVNKATGTSHGTKEEDKTKTISLTKTISFDGARFKDGLSFEGNDFVDRDRTLVSFAAAIFDKPDRVIFHSVILHPSWFINVDSRKFNFVNVGWGFLEKRGAIQREFQVLENNQKGYLKHLLAVTFRQLAVNAEDNNRYEEAANFRYMAMDAKRLERWRKVDLLRLSWWYWLLSGYGERVQRAFGMLLVFWFVFAIIYWSGDATWWQPKQANKVAVETTESVNQQPVVSYPLTFPESLVYSLGVMTLQKPEPVPANKRAKVFVLLETVVGPIQAALLALAIRRKFMR